MTQVWSDAGTKAGVRRGDVITSVDGTSATTAQELQRLIERTATCRTTHHMEIVRDQKSLTLAFAPEPEPENYGVHTSGHDSSNGESSEGIAALGIKLDNLTLDIARQLDLKDSTCAVITGVEPAASPMRQDSGPEWSLPR